MGCLQFVLCTVAKYTLNYQEFKAKLRGGKLSSRYQNANLNFPLFFLNLNC